MKTFLLKLLLVLVFVGPFSFAADKPVITIGIYGMQQSSLWTSTIGPTLEYLRKKIPNYEIKTFELEPDAKTPAPNMDFFIASPIQYWEEHLATGATAVAVRNPYYSGDPNNSMAGVVIVPVDNSSVRTISDLKGKTPAVVSNNSKDEFLAYKGYLADRGFNPDDFIAGTTEVSIRNPGVVSALIAKRADYGILGLCEIEELDKQGLINKNDFKVIDAKPDPSSNCLHTTDLFPNIVFATTAKTNPNVVKEVASALFSMPKLTSGEQWGYANDFTKIDQLSRTLKIGPYAYLQEWTPEALWKRFSNEIILLILLIFAIIFHIVRTNYLVYLRTKELKSTLEEKERIQVEAKKNRELLARMERVGIISQIGSVIAHELKQPLGAIANYSNGLAVHLSSGKPDPGLIAQVIDKIQRQAQQASEVIDYVRGFAKKDIPNKELEQCDLSEIVDRALTYFSTSFTGEITIRKHLLPNCLCQADSKGLELAVYNLIKNAAEATSDVPNPTIEVSIKEDNDYWAISVRDNGKAIDDKTFERLQKPFSSIKQEGLGLGLTITKNIIRKEFGRLVFEKNPTGGLTATIYLPKIKGQ